MTLSQSSDFLSAVCVSKSRDKVQPLTRVPVRTTRNAKERWWSDIRDVDLSPLTIIPCLGLDIHRWYTTEHHQTRDYHGRIRRNAKGVLFDSTAVKLKTLFMWWFLWRARQWIGVSTHMFGVKSCCCFDNCLLFLRQNLETIISKLSKEQPNGRRNSFMLVSTLFITIKQGVGSIRNTLPGLACCRVTC